MIVSCPPGSCRCLTRRRRSRALRERRRPLGHPFTGRSRAYTCRSATHERVPTGFKRIGCPTQATLICAAQMAYKKDLGRIFGEGLDSWMSTGAVWHSRRGPSESGETGRECAAEPHRSAIDIRTPPHGGSGRSEGPEHFRAVLRRAAVRATTTGGPSSGDGPQGPPRGSGRHLGATTTKAPVPNRVRAPQGHLRETDGLVGRSAVTRHAGRDGTPCPFDESTDDQRRG